MKKLLVVSIGFVCLILVNFIGHLNAGTAENEKIMPQMIAVPGGEFIMGMDVSPLKEGEKKSYVNNRAHKVYVDAFLIDKYEVTNYQYYLFCKATDRKLPIFWGLKEFHCGPDFPNFPVVGVSYGDALAYAKWRGVRLPTEAEWEYAARGGLVGEKFPNGDNIDEKSANYRNNQKGTTAVGSFPANGYGLHDMSGNVREWVLDYYQTDYYLTSPYKNPRGPEIGGFRVVRSGGWLSGPSCVAVYSRSALDSYWVDFAVGFRCAEDAPKTPEGKE
jgi:formylglycine-generating enzyme required for sulfatase activity